MSRFPRLTVESLEAREVPATFTVTSLLDNGTSGTLRWAVDQANTTAGADTITFASGVAGKTITLAQGQLTLTDSATTTIDGGAAGVTIDGNRASRLFLVRGGASAALGRLTLTNGVSNEGGGIYNSGKLVITDCAIRNNSAVDYSAALYGFGGGIANYYGTLTVSASIIAGNSADFGGGIYNYGTLTVSASTLSDNSASVQGGGIDNTVTLFVSESTFVNNYANSGGGLSNYIDISYPRPPGMSEITAIVSASTFANNSATYGGGISNSSGPGSMLTVLTSTLTGNSATFGGGINNKGMLTVAASTLAGNSARGALDINIGSGLGGGIVNHGTLTVSASTLAGNSTDGVGSGIFASDKISSTVLASSIVADRVSGSLAAASANNLLVGVGSVGGLSDGVNGNIVVPTVADVGLDPAGLKDNGGPTQTIALLASSPAVNRGVLATDPLTADQRGVSRDSRPDIGAFEFTAFQPSLVVTTLADEDDGTSDPRVGSGTSLREAVAYANAHAGPDTITFAPAVAGKTLVLARGQLTLTGSALTTIDGGPVGVTIDGNHATRLFEVNGGAFAALKHLSVLGGKEGVVNRGTLAITSSTVSDNWSAGVFNFGTLAIAGSTIRRNSGRGIINFGTLAVTDSTVSENSGGGIHNGDSGTLRVIASTIGNNTGVNESGGIYNLGKTVVTESTVSNNTVLGTSRGGGIYNGSQGTMAITASTVSNNSADTALGIGGGVFNDGKLTVTASTVSGNRAPEVGGIFNSPIGTMAINASTVSGNTAEFYGSTLNSGDATLTNSLLADGVNGIFTSSSANNLLVGIGSVGGLTNGVNGNIVVATVADVGLDPAGLKDNGGPTQTIALLATSPAVGKGLAGGTTDQRGVARNANPDIGAFETTATSITVTAAGGTYNGSAYGATGFTVTGPDPALGTVTYAYYAGTLTAVQLATATPLPGAPKNAGSYTVAATFTPSAVGYRPSTSAAVPFAIAKATPTVNLTLPQGAVYSGSAFSATATVTGVSNVAGTTLEGVAPTLVYYPGPAATGTPLASAPVNAGTYTVVAAFAGSDNYALASDVKSFHIAPAAVAVGLTTDRPVAVPGLAVTFTATVSAANGAAITGAVTFKDGTTVLGTVAVVNGVARMTTDAFQYGNSTVTSEFAGGPNYTPPAARPAVAVSVVPAAVLFDPLTGMNALFVGGTPGDDEIEIKREGNDRYEVQIDGGGCPDEYEREFRGPVGRVVVYAGAGDDEVEINGNVRVPVWVFGGAGDDDLEGGENAPNVLVGGAGNDRLRGGTGRDILIGGAGTDELNGKGGDDLMIGGTTAFDLSEPALWGVQLEWTSDRTYEQRVANLRGTGGGPRLNGNTFLVASGVGTRTVSDDGVGDRFKGGSGRDWYFGRRLNTPSDRFDDLAGNEFVDEVN